MLDTCSDGVEWTLMLGKLHGGKRLIKGLTGDAEESAVLVVKGRRSEVFTVLKSWLNYSRESTLKSLTAYK